MQDNTQIIFDAIWTELETEFGASNLCFPREILWLNGAPGAGKGTQTPFMIQCRDFYKKPLVVSELLSGEQFREKMDSGSLVGDKEVTERLFRSLLDPAYKQGLIVDGYPRSPVQAECLKLFFDKLNSLYKLYRNTPYSKRFPKPKFHIVVLFIDEKESIQRQIFRAKKAMSHNEEVTESGMGNFIEIRQTDIDESTTQKRYRIFRETTYEALKSLKKVFQYHYINAKGSVKEIQERILQELRYQSSLELRQETFDSLTPIPLASEIARYARQELIERLDDYQEKESQLFKEVIYFIENELLSVIRRHSISGQAQMTTSNPLFEHPLAVSMLIDIMSERGYHAIVDTRYYDIPTSFDLASRIIHTKCKKSYLIIINFPGAEIRKGE